MKDYSRKPYMTSDYNSMLTVTPLQEMQNKQKAATGTKLPESEFKKPYLPETTYDKMEYPWDGHPGFPPSIGTDPSWDLPWMAHGMPTVTGGSESDQCATKVFYCTAGDCYNQGATTFVPFRCTQNYCASISDDGTVPAGYSWTGNCRGVWITAPDPATYTFTFRIKFPAVHCTDSNGKELKNSKGQYIWIPQSETDVMVSPCAPGDKCKNLVGSSTTIDWSTQFMLVGTQQQLNILNQRPGVTYNWYVSGVGTISSTGLYTAPATNPGCNNPTITLTADGQICDQLDIAVYQVVAGTAFETWEKNTLIVPPCAGSNPAYCNYTIFAFSCLGGTGTATSSPYTWAYPDCPACWATVATIRGSAESAPKDVRTAAQLAAGCCPLELM